MTVRKVSVKKPAKHKVRVKRRKGATTPAPVFSDATEDDSGSTEDSASEAPAPKKRTAKKATAKKRTAKKSAAKKAPAKKTTAKKTAAKPAPKKSTTARKRKAAAPAPAKKERKPRKTGGKNEYPRSRKKPVREEGPGGYLAGSNSAIAVEEMLKGGEDRAEVGRRIVKRCGPTRQGHPVNASGMISALLLQLADEGYVVESHWVLKEPTPQSKAAATRRKNAREKKAAAK